MASISSFSVASLSLPKSQSLDPDNLSDSSFSGKSNNKCGSCCFPPSFERRKIVLSSIAVIAGTFCKGGIALASEFADMPALRGKDYGKSKMRYPDYVETESGLQYKDLRPGYGPTPKKGETVVVIPAFEEAVSGMSLGGIRRIIVPPELGYPENDYNKGGPRPTTFSGQRALDFVLRNQGLIDKTLLFDIELMKIVPN